jgi:Tfp pilus assembly protein PilF
LGVTASPTHTAALLTEQGQRAMAQGQMAQAYDRFSQAIELDPANAAAWLGRGLVAQQKTEKRICFQRALALEPGNTQAQMELQRLDTSIKGF